MGQITFSIDSELEKDFRRKVGAIYGARRDSIGIALREVIGVFIQVSNDTKTESSNRRWKHDKNRT
jgi:hypothetical protein